MRHARVPESVICDRNIPDAAFRVLVCLADFADNDGFCYPSVRTLAHDLGRTRSTIRHHLNRLVELGRITREPRSRSDGSRGANRYCVVALRRCTEPDAAPADQHAAAAAGDQPQRSGANQPSLLLPLNGGNRRTAGGRSGRNTPSPARRRRAGLIAATALAEIPGWAT
jgi:hypothetical protein